MSQFDLVPQDWQPEAVARLLHCTLLTNTTHMSSRASRPKIRIL